MPQLAFAEAEYATRKRKALGGLEHCDASRTPAQFPESSAPHRVERRKGRKASVRAQAEHPVSTIERQFGKAEIGVVQAFPGSPSAHQTGPKLPVVAAEMAPWFATTCAPPGCSR